MDIEQQVEAVRENLVTRLNISIERALVAIEAADFPKVVRNKIYRPVEKKSWLRRRTVVVYRLDKGPSGDGVVGWELNEKRTWLLLADGQLAYFNYITDRALAELAGCEPTTNYAVVGADTLSIEELEGLIEAIGSLEQKCLLIRS